MGITRTVLIAIIALLVLVGGAAWYFGHEQGNKAPENTYVSGTKVTTTEVTEPQSLLPNPPAYIPYLVLVKYTYQQEGGYPQNRPPIDLVTWQVESQKQPSRDVLEKALSALAPGKLDKLTDITILSVSRIDNRAWWSGKYIRIDALAPEDDNEPPQK